MRGQFAAMLADIGFVRAPPRGARAGARDRQGSQNRRGAWVDDRKASWNQHAGKAAVVRPPLCLCVRAMRRGLMRRPGNFITCGSWQAPGVPQSIPCFTGFRLLSQVKPCTFELPYSPRETTFVFSLEAQPRMCSVMCIEMQSLTALPEQCSAWSGCRSRRSCVRGAIPQCGFHGRGSRV